ncbi:MAG: MmcQ/YjbR family DNA-binding protein [Chitinophagales bacterium]|nr:MmcQ/YjbR family DNA-binding protein [Chitinophagales bacterium]
MNVEEFRLFCLERDGVEECFPFDQSTLVFKVYGKMFALCGLDNARFSVNLKCDPEYAEELREKFGSVQPGYHMNKKHWNTVYLDEGEINDSLAKDLILHSYDLVFASISKKIKDQIKLNK